MSIHPAFHRLQLLVGASALRSLGRTRVLLIGTGGIGSWCAEGLVRNGIGHLTLLDGASIAIPHINRELHANMVSNGRPKAEELRDRLELIQNSVTIEALVQPWSAADKSIDMAQYDYVIDAVDDWETKAGIISAAWKAGVPVFTALDPNGRLDPTRIRVADISCTECPSGETLWQRLQEIGPTGECLAVYSSEPAAEATEQPLARAGKSFRSLEPGTEKRTLVGSAVHVTATFGMVLAGLVVDHVIDGNEKSTRKNRVISPNHDDDGAPEE